MTKEIYRSSKARIIQVETGEFEVSHLLTNKRGEIIEPTDENFGVWAWGTYSLQHAQEIAKDIEEGRKVIVSMENQV